MKKTTYFWAFINGLVSAILAIFILKYIEWKLPIIGDRYYLLLSAVILFPLIVWIGDLLFRRFKVILQAIRFVEVGFLNTFIDFGVLNFLMWSSGHTAGWFFPLFKATSFTISTINSYLWNKYWSFEEKETKAGAGQFGRFYVVAGIGLLLNVGIASFVVNVMGPQFGLSPKIWANVGAGIAVLIVATWDFLGYKFLVFKK